MNETMTVKDAELRLDQLKNGKIPPKEVPTLANPMYTKAYDGFMKHGTTCNTLIGCMWQRINTFVGGTVDGVEDDSKYGCYFAVPINTVLKANEANEVMYRTTAKSLITDDTGRVTGVTCEMYDGTPVTLHANKAVILVTGGIFAGNRLGGNAISEILVSGRIAGQAAAAE